MTLIWLLVGGFFIAFLFGAMGWFFASGYRQRQFYADKEELLQQITTLEARSCSLNEQFVQQTKYREAIENNLESMRQQRDASREEVVGLSKDVARLENERTYFQEKYRELELEHSQIEKQYHELNVKHETLKATLEQKQQHFDDQLENFKTSRDQLKEAFTQLADDLFIRKEKDFRSMSKESLLTFLEPFKTEIKSFKEKVESIHAKETEHRIQLRAELQNLQKLNQGITTTADKLAKALQGQKKLQGNWGELLLENVLNSSGLRLGQDYKREITFKTEDGQQRPDVVVFLPGEKHLIIDAKTSLVDYMQFINSVDKEEKLHFQEAHATAVAHRIDELSKRQYEKIPDLNSPDMVIMFIPIESAYVAAVDFDTTLYQRAIEKKVLVATPMTLLASLHLVSQLWRLENQARHSAELAKRAQRFHGKLNSFLSSMLDVGKNLDKAKLVYDRALGQLYRGRGNLIKQADEFKSFGVSVQSALPVELSEKATLELNCEDNI